MLCHRNCSFESSQHPLRGVVPKRKTLRLYIPKIKTSLDINNSIFLSQIKNPKQKSKSKHKYKHKTDGSDRIIPFILRPPSLLNYAAGAVYKCNNNTNIIQYQPREHNKSRQQQQQQQQ